MRISHVHDSYALTLHMPQQPLRAISVVSTAAMGIMSGISEGSSGFQCHPWNHSAIFTLSFHGHISLEAQHLQQQHLQVSLLHLLPVDVLLC